MKRLKFSLVMILSLGFLAWACGVEDKPKSISPSDEPVNLNPDSSTPPASDSVGEKEPSNDEDTKAPELISQGPLQTHLMVREVLQEDGTLKSSLLFVFEPTSNFLEELQIENFEIVEAEYEADSAPELTQAGSLTRTMPLFLGESGSLSQDDSDVVTQFTQGAFSILASGFENEFCNGSEVKLTFESVTKVVQASSERVLGDEKTYFTTFTFTTFKENPADENCSFSAYEAVTTEGITNF